MPDKKESQATKSYRQLKAKGLSETEVKKRIVADFSKEIYDKIKQ